MNSTHNVNDCTKAAINVELKRGLELTTKILAGQMQWKELFEPLDFFSSYKHFIQVRSYSENEEDWRMFSGLVDARVRNLVVGLSEVSQLVSIRCYPFSFENHTNDEIYRYAYSYYI